MQCFLFDVQYSKSRYSERDNWPGDMSTHIHLLKVLVGCDTSELVRKWRRFEHGGKLVDVRVADVEINGQVQRVRRCFVLTPDSGILVNVGWVMNTSASYCLLCRTPFTWRRRARHCRACGLLVCRSCSPHRGRFMAMPAISPEPVCLSCGLDEVNRLLSATHLMWC